MSLETTGRSAAIASRTARPHPSLSEREDQRVRTAVPLVQLVIAERAGHDHVATQLESQP